MDRRLIAIRVTELVQSLLKEFGARGAQYEVVLDKD